MGAITGIVIGVLLVLTPLAVLGCFIFLHRYSGIPRCCPHPQVDPSPRGRTPHPPISSLELQDPPLPHGYSQSSFSSCLTRYGPLAASLTPSSFILLFSGEVVSISFATPWTHLSVEFPRQEYWSGLPFPSPGNLPAQVSKLCPLNWQVDSLPMNHQERPIYQLTQLRPLLVLVLCM